MKLIPTLRNAGAKVGPSRQTFAPRTSIATDSTMRGSTDKSERHGSWACAVMPIENSKESCTPPPHDRHIRFREGRGGFLMTSANAGLLMAALALFSRAAPIQAAR